MHSHMPLFIKTENFTSETLKLPLKSRSEFIEKHKSWVAELNSKGRKIISGYLVDDKKVPGGGGVLILEANSYKDAITLVKKDPMISKNLVTWEVHEWIPVIGTPIM